MALVWSSRATSSLVQFETIPLEVISFLRFGRCRI